MSNFPSFVHLRLHTEYSLSNGLIRVKPLVKAVIAGGMPACAITDQTNLFAVVKFYRAATQAGIKPIVGVDFQLMDATGGSVSQLVLLAQNEDGYRNLCRLVSRCYQEGQDSGNARLYRHWLTPDSTTGLIALSGGRQGEIGQALLTGKSEAAAESWADWNALFPQRFYLELQRTGRSQEEVYIQAALKFAVQHQIPVVATNAVHFLKPDDFEAHEARVCIQDGAILADPRRARLFSEQQYLRSAAEMAELFADIPEALANTVEIAKRCNLRLQLGKNYLPDFPVPAGQTVASFFRQQSAQGLEQRLNQLFPEESLREHQRPQYFERLQFELEVIIAMGFPGYFLIVADFIRWAKANGVPVGPGRGSGAGSLVAYALQITDLDPLAYDLLFERFLNPERVSLPDFDVDFCMEGRDRVIEYVSEHYGRERVSQIITYGSMKAKAVIRDVGRVLGHSYPFVDKLAKLIPFDLDMTLEKALAEEEILQQRYQQEEEVKILFDLARSLEGIARNAGRHAGGVVIAPSVLTDFSPLYCERGGGGLATQFDKDDVEAVGLVKFDFLGLRTLTIIDWAVKTINRQQAPAVLDITTLPMDDPASFALLKRCETTAVFQLESRGMKDLIKRLQPDCFEDIIALVALFRPGPLQSGMVDDFINRKHGRAKVEYPHPDLEPILKPTYGVILYQEQVMQIAQVLAGYTLGGADMLRRAMGKKKAEEMAKQRSTFLEGATQRGVAAEVAGAIFDLMEKFAGYGFNKTLHKNTEIYTLKGIKKIKDCKAGDQVVSIVADGSYACAEVIALHDHGQVPLWEIQFDDGTIERCTLDHKWLTEKGQQPLWKIIRMGSQVWGSPAYQARHPCTSEAMSYLHEYDSDRPIGRQGKNNALRQGHQDAQRGQHPFSKLRSLSGHTQGNSGAYLQRTQTYARNAAQILRNCEENIRSSRCSAGKSAAFEGLAGHASNRIPEYPSQSTCFSKIVKNGTVVRTPFDSVGVYTQHAASLPESAQTNRLRTPPEKNGNRDRWPVAFSSHSLRTPFANSTGSGSDAEPRNYETILALNPAFDGVLQEQLWRAYLTRIEPVNSDHRQWRLGRDIVLRKPVRAMFVGWSQGYDLEVAHPEHNFLLASGLCCSNSHSAAYALLSYQTAWLKAHYPAAFMAAVLSADCDNTDKVVILIEECRAMKLTVQPPNINRSDYAFTVAANQDILYGLGAIKGVGSAALDGILHSVRTQGAYQSLFDLCCRVDLGKVNRRVLESLIRAGALDELGRHRASLLHHLPEAVQMAEQSANNQAAGMMDLFGGAAPQNEVSSERPVAEWPEIERLKAEKATLGLYLTGHPITEHEAELSHFISARLNALEALLPSSTSGAAQGGHSAGRRYNLRETKVVIAGLVVELRIKSTARGKMVFVILDDRAGRVEVVVYGEIYDQYRDYLIEDQLLVIKGSVSTNDFSGGVKMTADTIYTIEQARAQFVKSILLTVSSPPANPQWVAALAKILSAFRLGGTCPLWIDYQNSTAAARLILGPEWRVQPQDELIRQLRQWGGGSQVVLNYK